MGRRLPQGHAAGGRRLGVNPPQRTTRTRVVAVILNGIQNASQRSGPAVWGTWLTGTAPLTRLSSLQTAGVFDRQDVASWEDVGLGVMMFRAGGGLHAVSDAIVHQIANPATGGETSRRRPVGATT